MVGDLAGDGQSSDDVGRVAAVLNTRRYILLHVSICNARDLDDGNNSPCQLQCREE